MTSKVYPKSMNLFGNTAIYRIIFCGVSNTTISFLNVFYSCPTTNSDFFLLEHSTFKKSPIPPLCMHWLKEVIGTSFLYKKEP